MNVLVNPLNDNPTKMVKHIQTICRLLPTNCLSVFYHSVGLALKKSIIFSRALQRLPTKIIHKICRIKTSIKFPMILTNIICLTFSVVSLNNQSFWQRWKENLKNLIFPCIFNIAFIKLWNILQKLPWLSRYFVPTSYPNAKKR